MKKNSFNSRERESVNAKVLINTEDRLDIVFYWYVWIKKNWRVNMRWISLPSKNYTERHKRIMKALWKTEWKFNSFPCKLDMKVLYWTRRRTDLDNRLSSIMDLYQDLWIIEDDCHDIIPEISMSSVWYIKNSPIMIVSLIKSTLNRVDDDTDYKGLDLSENLKSFINN